MTLSMNSFANMQTGGNGKLNGLQLSFLLVSLMLMGVGVKIENVEGANIAFYIPTGSYSHRVSLWPLVEKLVGNGHHITFISAYPPKNPLPNVTEIIPEEMAKEANDFMQGGDLDITQRISGNLDPGYELGPKLGYFICEKYLDDPTTKAWLKSDPKIDLFVVDWFTAECILGLAWKLKAPFIYYSPTVMVPPHYDQFGILQDTAGIPDYDRHFTPPMNFWQRLHNTVLPLIWRWKMLDYYEKIGTLMRERYNVPDMPPVDDLVRNASLMMWSESVIEGYPHQLPPNWIPVGGMHCKEQTDALPDKLENIVQRGKDGFIYISFGSAVVPGNLPVGHRTALFNAIRSFPNIQFLWKWTGEMPKEGVPPNLFIDKWFPQQDILAHKKILAFVTQAGRPSTQEAIYRGVPMIAMPVFEDQDYTADRVKQMGGGLVLEIATIKEKEFYGAIKEITTNPKYKATMQRLSKLFRDRPMNPADTALWWTEYVLRHNGNLDHFRTPSFNLTWYQRRAVDVWAFLIVAALLAAFITVYILMLCLKLICKSVMSASSKESKSSTRRGDVRKKNK